MRWPERYRALSPVLRFSTPSEASPSLDGNALATTHVAGLAFVRESAGHVLVRLDPTLSEGWRQAITAPSRLLVPKIGGGMKRVAAIDSTDEPGGSLLTPARPANVPSAGD